jgi:integrase
LIPVLDTDGMNDQPPAPPTPKRPSLWQKTKFANLIRYVPSGTYFARVRIRGKLIVRSLRTNGISVAKLRLSDLEKEERQRAEVTRSSMTGKMTFGDALALYRQRLEADASIKPRTKAYRLERIKAILKSWPGLETMDVRRITKPDCLAWAERYGGDCSPSNFNNSVGTLRMILNLAVEAGALYDNPARFIKRHKIRLKQLQLPTQEQFRQFVHAIRQGRVCSCHQSADLVEFLAFGGFRRNEAWNVTWADCDFERGEIVVRGDPVTGTKNSEVRRVPMIPDMRQLLERLKEDRPEDAPADHVMKIRECTVTMDRVAKQIGMPRITHHDLRHLFATRCIESGVDIPTVSRWLGHKDGGALAMKVYGHLRDQHSTAMARKVSF